MDVLAQLITRFRHIRLSAEPLRVLASSVSPRRDLIAPMRHDSIVPVRRQSLALHRYLACL